MASDRMAELKAEFQSAVQRLKAAKELDERQAVILDARRIVLEFNELVRKAQRELERNS